MRARGSRVPDEGRCQKRKAPRWRGWVREVLHFDPARVSLICVTGMSRGLLVMPLVSPTTSQKEGGRERVARASVIPPLAAEGVKCYIDLLNVRR